MIFFCLSKRTTILGGTNPGLRYFCMDEVFALKDTGFLFPILHLIMIDSKRRNFFRVI